MPRPEYIKCIRKPGPAIFATLCGRTELWAFTSLEHAENSVKNGSRMVPCKACLKLAQADSETPSQASDGA